MVLLFHISVALFSIIFTTFGIFSPSQKKLYTSYVLTTLTISSGTYLIIADHANLLRTCLTGLVYLAIIFSGIVTAQRKLTNLSELN